MKLVSLFFCLSFYPLFAQESNYYKDDVVIFNVDIFNSEYTSHSSDELIEKLKTYEYFKEVNHLNDSIIRVKYENNLFLSPSLTLKKIKNQIAEVSFLKLIYPETKTIEQLLKQDLIVVKKNYIAFVYSEKDVFEIENALIYDPDILYSNLDIDKHTIELIHTKYVSDGYVNSLIEGTKRKLILDESQVDSYYK